MKTRRSVRNFSDEPVEREIIENCIKAASTAPSGANHQPWKFVVVSDPKVKKEIREAAESIEEDFYTRDSTKKWVNDLQDLGTVPKKPFLEKAPYLIVVFSESYGVTETGEKQKHYYVQESVGIATGILIIALHLTGLATLTYTPAKMRFLSRILFRPDNEKPFMIIVTGYPAANATVPDINKKSLTEISHFI